MSRTYRMLISLFFIWVSPSAFSNLADVEKEIKKSQENFKNQFTNFTQDKNYMGKPRNPDGSIVQGKTKTGFNTDDKVPFQSELTYHDFAYEVEDEKYAQQVAAKKGTPEEPKVKRRYVYAGISEHGAASAGSGASQLERVAYAQYDKFAKEESEQEKKEEDEKKGFNYRGVFKVNTQEVFKDQNGNTTSANDKDSVPEKVERWELREEARPEIAKVGENSIQTLTKSAKTEADDPNAMPNLAYYYDAANQALVALWNSTLSNLGQRRAYKAVDPKSATSNVKLSLNTPSCDAWGQQTISQLDIKDPQAKQKAVEDIQRMVKQCNEVAQTDFRDVNPRFEKKEKQGGQGQGQQAQGGNGGGDEETLTMKGPDQEDSRERDWRVQLSVMQNVKTQAQDVGTNWKYTDDDNRSKVTTGFGTDGSAQQTETLKMVDQVERYNKNLDDASKGISEVQAKFPQMKANAKAPLQFKKTGEESAMEITQFPKDAGVEGFETPVINKKGTPATNYKDLVDGKTAE